MESQTNNNYLLYKITSKDLYVAVSTFFARQIRQYAAEYQGLAQVPSDKLVNGVLFKAINDHLYEITGDGQEVQISVNILEFDTGDLRLTA